MNLRKLCTAMAVVAVLGLVLAATAYGKAETKAGGWVTGEVLEVGKSAAVTCSASQSFVLETEIGTTPFKFTATGAECLEASVNEVENSGKMAEFSGKLKLTGITVNTPASCAISGGSVTTVALTGKIQMEGSTTYLLLAPSTGTTLSTLTLVKGTGACAISGSYILSGNDFGRFNPTGYSAASQPVVFSGAINSTAGGELKLGSKLAALSGVLRIALSSGGTFKTEETPSPPAGTHLGQWYVKGTKLGVGNSKALKCSAAENFFIRGLILGAAAEIKATGVECVSAQIKQVEAGGGIMSELEGQLKLTGVSVVKPEGCKIANTLTLSPETSRIYMGGENAYSRYARPFTESLATVKLEECAAAGSYPLAGEVFGQWSPTGTSAEAQGVSFSEAIQNGAGGSLLLGGEVAQVTGKANLELTEGGAWKVEEK